MITTWGTGGPGQRRSGWRVGLVLGVVGPEDFFGKLFGSVFLDQREMFKKTSVGI